MSHLILSLDTNEPKLATQVINHVGHQLSMIKIGHCLLSHCEKSFIKELCGEKTIMLDTKFYDIENTVLKAVEGYKKSFNTLKYYTFSTLVDEKCIKSLVSNDFGCHPTAVLILSSSEPNLELFLSLAKKNYELGIKHFICPPAYIELMRNYFANDVVLFSPGIRGNNSSVDDHKNAHTAKQAISLGTNYIIVGRPIMNATDPNTTIKEYLL